MGKPVMLLLAATFVSLIFGGIAISADFDMEKASQLLEVKCSKCHAVERPRGKNKSKEEWTTTVKRMQSKSPGWFSDEEAQILIEYLSREHGQ